MLKAGRPGLGALCVLTALLLTIGEATAPRPRPLLLGAALLLLAYGARGVPRVVAVLAALAWTAQLAARVHGRVEAGTRAGRVEAELSERLDRLERRKQELVDLVQSAAVQAAALPDVRAATSGDPPAVLRAFVALEGVRDDLSRAEDGGPRPALAVHGQGRVLAWSGRTNEPPVPAAPEPARSSVYVLEGTVSTTLVALAPVPGDPSGSAVVTSALALAARRNIRNEFLRDFDYLAGEDPGLEIRYVDVRARPEEVEGFPPLDPALQGREAVLRAPSGHALALARVTAPRRPQPSQELELRYRRLLSLLVLLALLAWGTMAPFRWRAPVALTVARGALLYLRPPWPGPGSVLLSPEVYASDALARSLPALGALLRSPLDLLLTAAWLLALAVVAVAAAARAAPREPSLPRALAAGALSLPVIAGAFFLLADAVANSALDLETMTLLPRSSGHFVMQLALLLVLAAAGLLVTALFTLAGPWPRPIRDRLAFAAAALVPALVALRAFPPAFSGAPLLPALALVAVAALAGSRAPDLGRWTLRVGAGAHAGLAIAASAVLAAVLYPSLVRFSERNTRQQVEQRYAREVTAQPEVRRFVLRDAEHRVDALRLLEETPSSLRRGGLEELAFFAWSSTELALRGVSSAIEIQDASGALVSRFALNLPSLSSLPLPANEQWKEDSRVAELGGDARTVLHARRLLTYHGAVHGAVHVMVADDFWNLPFLRGRDPYSELFRTRPARDRQVEFLTWDEEGVAFSSAERPAPLPEGARARVQGGAYWTSLELDGRPHDAYLFASARGLHALAVPSLTRGTYIASLVEAVAAFTLLAVLAVTLVVLVRTTLRRETLTVPSLARAAGQRFVRRLLVAFLAVAVCPVVVMQVLVHRFVAGRLREEFMEQARERAEVARKVARDYVHFLRREQGPGRPLTDDPLVWIADTVGNDVDVFEQGRLLASSKREIYDAGLLPRRASGAVYREVILQGQPFYVRNERIGAFTYSVASVPLQLEEAGEPWILSLPLVLPQRDVQATVADIERRVRLASVVFFVLAAGLAHSMARRISGPISSLTEATRRIAQGDLDARVAATSGDELRHLVEGFNQMACELETQRRDLERSNRLAAWAEMARQVAHEVKNPLTPIQLSAEHLRRVWQDRERHADFGATLEACTDAILKQVRSLRGIVTEFSAFARPPAAALAPQDPAALLEEIVRPYQAALPQGVVLTLETAPAPAVMADRRLLERAIVNLIENALQAVGQKGRIAVRLRRPSPDRVEIEVADSGPGLDPEVRDRIFEPFFSTKTAGSGLGLALVKKTVEDHGGGVRLESEPGAGTRAILWLPATGAKSAAPDDTAPAAEPAEAATTREG
jgi:two-component system, NtrC family, nitrogen regulation sensor histidine kinase NtrY